MNNRVMEPDHEAAALPISDQIKVVRGTSDPAAAGWTWRYLRTGGRKTERLGNG